MNHEEELFEAILSLKNIKECSAFFRDLCTPSELEAMMQRWQIALLLSQSELSYREIQQQTKASLTTIGRVARFLSHENNHGYRNVLKKRQGNAP